MLETSKIAVEPLKTPPLSPHPAKPMPRPGPLRDLPLDQFLPSSTYTALQASRISKRPLSPGGPSLYSPTKRRILCEEGILSPERSCKTPYSSHTRGRSSVLFANEGSPAKKLSFGLPSRSMPPAIDMLLDSDPKRVSSSSSSELWYRSVTPHSSLSSLSADDSVNEETYFSSQSSSSSGYTVVARELPTPPDPQSIHYPGFRVHLDTHIVVVSSPFQDDASDDTNREARKENLPPRRKPQKVATATDATDLKGQIYSPTSKRREMERIGKAKSTPASPQRISRLGKDEGKALTPTQARVVASHRASPQLTGEEKKEMRRLLEEEVDENAGDDDEDLENVLY